MNITVKLFATLKDKAGVDSMELELPEGTKVAELISLISAELPALKEVLENRSVFISVNQDMAQKNDIIKEGDEIGLLPPFSGGK